jgi:hypothetical protein
MLYAAKSGSENAGNARAIGQPILNVTGVNYLARLSIAHLLNAIDTETSHRLSLFAPAPQIEQASSDLQTPGLDIAFGRRSSAICISNVERSGDRVLAIRHAARINCGVLSCQFSFNCGPLLSRSDEHGKTQQQTTPDPFSDCRHNFLPAPQAGA